MVDEKTDDATETEPMTGRKDAGTGEDVAMERRLGLLDGVAMIIGSIVGSGIFISPKGVLQSAGSAGMSIVIWALCGVITFIGAICYAELGTMIDRSGGNYAYLDESFGPLPAFCYIWAALLILIPVAIAINALAFAQYLLSPLWPAASAGANSYSCSVPTEAVQLTAAFAVASLCLINSYNVRWAARLQKFFMVTKVLAVSIVIVTGIVCFFTQDMQTRGLNAPFEQSTTDPSLIALSFYSGLFSYGGWTSLNSVVEEVKDPYRNLPRAIGISIPIVTAIYIMANVAYLVVLTPQEIVTSSAVVVTFGDRVFGSFTWIMQILVALSALGALHCNIFCSSRLFFVGARNDHLPKALALINLDKLTPIPAIVFIGICSIVMIFVGDIYSLINYIMFVDSVFLLFTVGGMLWLRRKKPDLNRPIKVNLLYPITFFLVCFFLVCFPVVSTPLEAVTALAIGATALPVYLVCVAWRRKPAWMTHCNRKFTLVCQKVFVAMPATDATASTSRAD